MNKARKGLGVGIWLTNILHYAISVSGTPFFEQEFSEEDKQILLRIKKDAKFLIKKYVEE